MIPQKLLDLLNTEGVVAFATQGTDGPHVVNTWHSYVAVEGDKLYFPAGGMKNTEENLKANSRVQLTMGGHDSEGKGVGFLIEGTAAFLYEGAGFDLIRSRFSWARSAVEIKVSNVQQTMGA